MKKQEIPVLLLTGYLGSGKTTLLNRILENEKGIRFAVIVNDIGEVNIDASLIQKGGIVGQDDSQDLIALQNGCICCTLKMDLVKQLSDIIDNGKFDYIVIEASGICEPEPIAQTLCTMKEMNLAIKEMPRLDCICTVVDALRLKSEFQSGQSLQKENLEEDDLENLIIQQIEFCDVILLNKISEITKAEADNIKAIIRALQPRAEIIECDYCDVPLTSLLNTNLFNYGQVASSATWIRALDAPAKEEDHHKDLHHSDESDSNKEHEHEHEHGDHNHHHHHHHDDEGEADEYGIQTWVYYRRKPMDLSLFDHFVAKKWPGNIIRSKGMLWLKQNEDMCYLFEQAGVQKKLSECGFWCATAPIEELIPMLENDPTLKRDWDNECGDRMIKLVFIGQNLDTAELEEELDKCLCESQIK